MILYFTEMMTVVTVCDGIVECHGGRDENWICKNNTIPFYGVLVFCCLILSFVFASKWYRQKKFKNEVGEIKSLLPTQLDQQMFLKDHVEPKFKKCLLRLKGGT